MSLKMEMKKNLVIATVGDSSLHQNWKPSSSNSYDLLLIYYGDGDGYPNDSKYYIRQKGTKYHLISNAIDSTPQVKNYNFIWMPDDDICITPNGIDDLFRIAAEYDLWLSQPSIIGWYGLAVTLTHMNCKLRYTNFVEIMCPCFRYDIMKKCQPTFKENKSGWGLDAIWNIVLGHPNDKLAIVDEVIAIHTRPVGGGDMYKSQFGDSSFESAMEEAQAVYKKYNLDKENYQDLKRGRAVSQELFYISYFNIVEYSRVFRSLEAGVGVNNRLWPPCNYMQDLCTTLRSKE